MRSFHYASIAFVLSLGLAACAAPVSDSESPEQVEEAAQAADRCDPDMICQMSLSCVNGLVYPTVCGPKNCDEPIGKCCDPNMICKMVLSCVDGLVYPTSCGPKNCDEPIGKCD